MIRSLAEGEDPSGEEEVDAGTRADFNASPAQSMSPVAQRASAAMTGRLTSAATILTDSVSASDAIGNPASMISTPSSSSWRASRSFSSTRIEKPGACSPSRRVVSKTTTVVSDMEVSNGPLTRQPTSKRRENRARRLVEPRRQPSVKFIIITKA